MAALYFMYYFIGAVGICSLIMFWKITRYLSDYLFDTILSQGYKWSWPEVTYGLLSKLPVFEKFTIGISLVNMLYILILVLAIPMTFMLYVFVVCILVVPIIAFTMIRYVSYKQEISGYEQHYEWLEMVFDGILAYSLVILVIISFV